MRIGISTSVIQRGKTGIGQYVFALLRAFTRINEAHEFVLFVLEEDLPLFEFAHGRMELAVVPERFRPPLRNIWWHQSQLPDVARQRGLNVLHIPSYRRMLWPKPCPLVATIHDLAPFHMANKYDWKRMFYGRTVVKHLAQRQDQIIAISTSTARDIHHYLGVDQERITTIHNGIDHERFCPGPKEAAKPCVQERGVNAPFFLYVARLEHPAKNHVQLIDAFEQFKAATRSKWKLVFVGSDWSGAEVVHARIKQSPVAADIHSLGFIPAGLLATFYRAADVFVYPSLFEGFGLPPIEAMACGCPVISSNRGSLREILGDAAIVLDPENTDAWAESLARVAGDAELREELQRAGLGHAAQFNWQKNAAETLKVYERAVKQTSVRH